MPNCTCSRHYPDVIPCSRSGPAHCTVASIATGYCRGYRQHHGGYARPAARVIGPHSSCSGQASPACVLFRKGQLQRAVADSTRGPLPQVLPDALHFSSCIENLACQVMYISQTHGGRNFISGFRHDLSASPHGKAALAGMPPRVQQQRQVIPAQSTCPQAHLRPAGRCPNLQRRHIHASQSATLCRARRRWQQ